MPEMTIARIMADYLRLQEALRKLAATAQDASDRITLGDVMPTPRKFFGEDRHHEHLRYRKGRR